MSILYNAFQTSRGKLMPRCFTRSVPQNTHPNSCPSCLTSTNRFGTPSRGNCFLGGDFRTNENAGMASIHTAWLNNHNFIVDQLR